MINSYDFDGTIYGGDSSVDFYKYCLKRNKKVLLQLPAQLLGILLYIFGVYDKTTMKEKVFSFLKRVEDPEAYVKDFWTTHEKKIKKWYLKQKKGSDLIISASPEFLLEPITKKLKIHLIASVQDIHTGKYLEKNCHDVEKVKRFRKEYKNTTIKEFYSDSMADKPMMDISKEAYYVKKNTIYDLKNDREGKISKYLKIDKSLFKIGVLYLVIPNLMQLFFWFNKYVSIISVILMIIATVFVLKKYKPLKQEEYYKIFDKKKLIILFLLILVLNILSGAGGIFPQNWDYHGRNAIFRDLIDNPWPVRYDYSSLPYESSVFGNGGILNYYFAFWLPGAAIGKITSFEFASLFMLFWQTLGVTLFFYFVCRFLKNTKYRYFLIFMAFGGLNVIGHIIMNKYWGFPIHPIGSTHIDTSMGYFSMSTFITQLFWVFNQSIPAWIATMLFLQEKDYKTCGFYFANLIPFAPFPMLGLLYLMFVYIIFGKNLDKLIDGKRIKELLTVENFLGCISILPIVFMYSLNESQKGCFIINYLRDGQFSTFLFNYGMYVILEFLIYIVILNKKNYKQMIMCFLFFTIVPLFYIGTGADLGNRSTIPLLIVLYLLVCQTLNTINKKDKKQFKVQVITILILLVASITNFNELFRSVKYNYLNHKEGKSNYADNYYSYKTFEGKEVSDFITNFVVKDDKSNKMLQWILR